MLKNKIQSKIKQISNDPNYSEVVKGFGFTFGTKVISLPFGYLFTWILSISLGAKVVGLYNLSLSILAIINLFVFMGFPLALVRFVGQYKDDDGKLEVLKKMFKISLPLSVIPILFTFLGDKLVMDIFKKKELITFLKIISISVPLSVTYSLLASFFQGLKKITISEGIRNSLSFSNTLWLVLAIFILKFGDISPAIAYDLSMLTLSGLLLTIFSIVKLKLQRANS